MRTLLYLFVKNGGFVTFVIMEVVAFYLIVQFNGTQRTIWAHSMGMFGGHMAKREQETINYFRLRHLHDSLAQENARLQQQLANERYRLLLPLNRDSSFTGFRDSLLRQDTGSTRDLRPAFDFIPAEVVGNTITGNNNYLTLNKGSNDGLEPDMAVVTRSGIVGIIRQVSPHFSYVMSVLHRQSKISAKVKRYNAAGSLVWEGNDPASMTLRYIPKHFLIAPGDTIVTSGFSQMFPKGMMIGTVAEKPELDGENPYFLIVPVRLSQDMSAAQDVYVVRNRYAAELDSLKQRFIHEQ